ncbi:MAG: hypothetical protein NT092_00060 [Bacteroidia bacterium]|nr:hypothetical protein [Bacteroidia bacterium]
MNNPYSREPVWLLNPQFGKIDYNVYVQNTNKKTLYNILWSPANNDTCIVGFNTPAELSKLHPEFAAHSKFYSDYDFFRSKDLGNYRLVPEFPGSKAPSALPADISLLLKRPKKDVPFVGAYPLN